MDNIFMTIRQSVLKIVIVVLIFGSGYVFHFARVGSSAGESRIGEVADAPELVLPSQTTQAVRTAGPPHDMTTTTVAVDAVTTMELREEEVTTTRTRRTRAMTTATTRGARTTTTTAPPTSKPTTWVDAPTPTTPAPPVRTPSPTLPPASAACDPTVCCLGLAEGAPITHHTPLWTSAWHSAQRNDDGPFLRMDFTGSLGSTAAHVLEGMSTVGVLLALLSGRRLVTDSEQLDGWAASSTHRRRVHGETWKTLTSKSMRDLWNDDVNLLSVTYETAASLDLNSGPFQEWARKLAVPPNLISNSTDRLNCGIHAVAKFSSVSQELQKQTCEHLHRIGSRSGTRPAVVLVRGAGTNHSAGDKAVTAIQTTWKDYLSGMQLSIIQELAYGQFNVDLSVTYTPGLSTHSEATPKTEMSNDLVDLLIMSESSFLVYNSSDVGASGGAFMTRLLLALAGDARSHHLDLATEKRTPDLFAQELLGDINSFMGHPRFDCAR